MCRNTCWASKAPGQPPASSTACKTFSGVRQASLPTVRLVRAQANRESHMATLNALRGILCGAVRAAEQKAPRAVRFLDLSDSVNALPETMNSLFTRGFQPMLSPSHLEQNASEQFPPDVETME